MDSLKSLYWNQGLFLRPQHFQQFALHTQAVSNSYSSIKSGVSSGISKLQFDNEALKNGMLVVQQLECVMPDGTLLVYPGNCNLAAVTIDAENADDIGKIDILIGIAPVAIDEVNLSQEGSKLARYCLNEESITPDLFDPRETAMLSTLNIDSRIIQGNQASQKEQLMTLKIAEVVSNAGSFEFDGSFIPKVLTLEASPVLTSFVKTIKQNLLSRFEQLESFSSLSGSQSSDISSSSLATLMAMNIISSYIPVFAQYEEVLRTSPQEVYLTFRKLIAQLSMFSKSVSILGESSELDASLIAFNQNNMSDCFGRAIALSKRLLDELTVDPELLIQLSAQGDSKYVASLTHEFTDPKNRLYLRMRTSENLENKLEELLQFVKLGADGQVDIYVKRALPGVQLGYLQRKPLGVASTPNSYYFSLNRDAFEWQKISESGRVGLIWANSPEDLCVELIAVKG